MIGLVVALAALAAPDTPAGGAPVFSVSFAQTVRDAVAVSGSLKAAGHEAGAASSRAAGAISPLLPQFSVDANYRYLDAVPELTVFPGKAPVALGAHQNYSVGPTATWTLWDWGASYEAWQGAGDRAAAEAAQRDLARRSVALLAAVTYIQAQMAAEQVRLVADALKVARTQHHDISLRQQAGNASRLDLLQAHQELLARQRAFAQARADLAAGLNDLFALTATGTGLDASLPLDTRAAADLPEGSEPPTLLVALDPLDEALLALEPAGRGAPDPRFPRIRYYDRLAEASRRAATGLTVSRLPRIQITSRVSLDYPNGPILEQVTQKSAGVMATMPIFTGTKLVRDAQEQRDHAAALTAQRDSAASDLARDWRKAAARLAQLRAQAELNRQAIAEAQETARLVYDSYRGGQARFIEVETANLHTLEAQVQDARTRAETLTQLAIMQSLSKED